MTDSLTAPYHFIFYQAIFAPNSAPNFKKSPQIDFGAQFGAVFKHLGRFFTQSGHFYSNSGHKKMPQT